MPQLICPRCLHAFLGPELQAGKTIRCPVCSKNLRPQDLYPTSDEAFETAPTQQTSRTQIVPDLPSWFPFLLSALILGILVATFACCLCGRPAYPLGP